MRRLIYLVLLLLIALPVYAAELKVEKILETKDPKVGEEVLIVLKFSNPFGQQVGVKIVDKNILGNNGLDIQCLEYNVPADEETFVGYEAITPFQEGSFTLDKAEVTYTNPETGKEEKVSSDELKVRVKEGTQSGMKQEVTTIYQCNGMNMRSTSYSSSSQQQSQSMEEQMKKLQEQLSQQSQMQQKQQQMQNNQLNQDASALKQQMQQQMQEMQKLQEEFGNNLGKNEELYKEHQKMMEQGYQQTNSNLDPTNSTSGNFEINYEKDGEQASIEGSMENNEIKEMQTYMPEDVDKAMELLENNTRFDKMEQDLFKEGFTRGMPELSKEGNMTMLNVPYEDGNETAAIKAVIEEEDVKEVVLERDRKNYALPIIFAILAVVLVYLAYKKYFKKEEEAEEVKKIEKPIDYRKEAMKILDNARRLFAAGKKKDAYGKAAKSVRFYYTHKIGTGKEITNSELIKELRKNKITYADTQKCLNLTSLVEFAKYHANKKDFDKICSLCGKVIK
jgi:hypothetical protein